MQQEEKGALAEFLESRARAVKIVDVSGFFGIDGKPIGRIAFRPPTAAEQHRALAGAHAYAREIAGDGSALANDPDFLEDVKLAFIAHAVCRRPEQHAYPAFPHPKWMFDKIEPERIAVLIRIANGVREELGPQRTAVTDEAVEALRVACVATAGSDDRHAVMAGIPRWYLEHVVTMLSIRIDALLSGVESP